MHKFRGEKHIKESDKVNFFLNPSLYFFHPLNKFTLLLFLIDKVTLYYYT